MAGGLEQLLLDALKELNGIILNNTRPHTDLREWLDDETRAMLSSQEQANLTIIQTIIRECEAAPLAAATRSEAPPDARPPNPLAVAIIAAELAALSVRVSMLERAANPDEGRG